MNKESYKLIESLFFKMLEFLQVAGLSDAHREVARFFDVGEYGLAFEAALDGCINSGQPIPEKTKRMLECMAKTMEMDSSVLDGLYKVPDA